MQEAAYWVEKLKMSPHPEGGYYKETYKSTTAIRVGNDPETYRSASTAIYFLLVENNFSAFHRIKSDELWHFYEGRPVEIFYIDWAGEMHKIILGNSPNEDQVYQTMVPAGCWFASRVLNGNGYSLVGCTVSPGFEFEDFEMAERNALLEQFPLHEKTIIELTR
jgi:predicted cupin superfamily sugar epimerase